jgi:hypothetical protein
MIFTFCAIEISLSKRTSLQKRLARERARRAKAGCTAISILRFAAARQSGKRFLKEIPRS